MIPLDLSDGDGKSAVDWTRIYSDGSVIECNLSSG
jgi:hypothetical protein